jgi:hypothetical protein
MTLCAKNGRCAHACSRSPLGLPKAADVRALRHAISDTIHGASSARSKATSWPA